MEADFQGMQPEFIKAHVRATGKTLKDLAAENGISDCAIYLALKQPSLSGERAISKYLGIPLYILWPDRWTRDGQRIRPRYAHKYNKVA